MRHVQDKLATIGSTFAKSNSTIGLLSELQTSIRQALVFISR